MSTCSAVGRTSAHFGDGSLSGGVERQRQHAVEHARLDRQLRRGVLRGRSGRPSARTAAPRWSRYGDFFYDDANTEGQGAYTLANFRVGVRGSRLFVEGWLRNAFNTFYMPVAFAYPGLAPSGFVGESGAPRTFGVRAGVSF